MSLCSGEENKVTVNDLRPATDYHAKWVFPFLFIKFSGNVLKVSLYLCVCINLQRLSLPLLTLLWVTNQYFWLSWPLSPFWKIREDCYAPTQHPSSFLHASTVIFSCSLSQAQCCLISLFSTSSRGKYLAQKGCSLLATWRSPYAAFALLQETSESGCVCFTKHAPSSV